MLVRLSRQQTYKGQKLCKKSNMSDIIWTWYCIR